MSSPSRFRQRLPVPLPPDNHIRGDDNLYDVVAGLAEATLTGRSGGTLPVPGCSCGSMGTHGPGGAKIYGCAGAFTAKLRWREWCGTSSPILVTALSAARGLKGTVTAHPGDSVAMADLSLNTSRKRG